MPSSSLLSAALLSSLLLASCTPAPSAPDVARVEASAFGTMPDGTPVDLYTLTNRNGLEVRVTNYGGIILSIEAPDRTGTFEEITLGFDTLHAYLAGSPYFGALIGRYGNRIAGGQFTLDGQTYTLATNNSPNHLHGGERGFDKVVWQAEPFESDTTSGLVLSYTSPDGEEGYPGTLRATVTYTLTDDDALIFDYAATTDAATPVNLTQHTYFNLTGDLAGDILGHELVINADTFTPVDETLIPTGEIRPVEGTPFDFRTATPIGARIDAENQQLAHGGGYDHNFVLTRTGATPMYDDSLALAARVYEPTSGRVMEVYTTEPGMQFYSGNFLDGSLTGPGGVVYEYRTGLALETQHFPDSPNQPSFPSTILRPGEDYQSRTTYRFSVAD